MEGAPDYSLVAPAAMPSTARLALRELLRTAPKHPSAEQAKQLVDALVEDAASAKHPLMSLGATLRHRAGHIDEMRREQIREAATASLVRLIDQQVVERAVTPAPLVGEWLTAREAARCLGVTEETLLERLRHEVHRRRLGWPMWDGYRWWIAVAAVDPERRATFLAAQPAEEPLKDLLPASCGR